jgi:hypothetical protein
MGNPLFQKNRINLSFIFSLVVLYFTSRYNYLLFHSLAEIFSIVVAAGIFMLAWNSRHLAENNYLLILGVAYLFVGGLDLLHTLSYRGLGVFTDTGANLPTQLWIAARYMESLSLLIAPVFLTRRVRADYLFSFYSVLTAALIAAIFYFRIFPDCFLEPAGLTAFKKNSEYLISLLLLLSIVGIFRKRTELDPYVFQMIVWSILLTICSELAFTFYISVYGLSNLIGHILKIISFFLIYRAIIETGLKEPIDLLFQDIKRSEQALREQRNQLELALSEIRTLSGLLPICASCKKIRDDKGYWNQIEVYIRDRSDADFTHGICPECVKKYYSKP